MLIETLGWFWGNSCSIPISCYLIGCSWFVMAFVNDIINDFTILNDYTQSKESAWKVKQQFHYIVQNMADTKQLSVQKRKKITDSMESSLATTCFPD